VVYLMIYVYKERICDGIDDTILQKRLPGFLLDGIMFKKKKRIIAMMNWLENITDKDFLQDNMTFASLYIAVYENMIDYVASNIKFFLCDYALKDGKEVCRETEAYKVQIKNRIVDEKGNRNAIKASFLWLVDRGAITVSEYGRFLELKEIRNRYAHEMVNVIYSFSNA